MKKKIIKTFLDLLKWIKKQHNNVFGFDLPANLKKSQLAYEDNTLTRIFAKNGENQAQTKIILYL
jgi:hypothetical protein